MSNVVSIEDNLPHVVHEVICVKCRHRYIACAPEKVLLKDYECPYCRDFGYIIKTGQI